MMTKTELKMMKFFVSNISHKYSLQSAGKELKLHQALAYRASQSLIKSKFIIPDENGLYHLNYKENHSLIIAIEYLRTVSFFDRIKNAKFKQFVQEVKDTIEENDYIFILFGSAVENERYRDYDLLLFFDSMKKVQQYENAIFLLAENYPSLPLHVNVDSLVDMGDMLFRKDEKNIVNESLNNHLFFYGAEQFYKILKKVRPYA